MVGSFVHYEIIHDIDIAFLVYNFEEKQIERCVCLLFRGRLKTNSCCSQVPVLHSVRDVTIAKGGLAALVSYEDKVNIFHYSPNLL